MANTRTFAFLALAGGCAAALLRQWTRPDTPATERLERSKEEDIVLREIAEALAGAADVDTVLQEIVNGARTATRAFGAYIERIAADDGDVEVVAVAGDGTPAEGTRVPYPGSLTEAMIEEGEPELLVKVGAIGESMAPYLSESCANCSGLVVPLLSRDEPLGALVLLRNREVGPFASDEVRTTRTLEGLASAALRRALLLEKTEQERRRAVATAREREQAEQRLRLLADAGAIFTGSLDYRDTLARVARLAVPALSDWCVVDLIEDGRVDRVAVAQANPAKESIAREIRRFPPRLEDPTTPAGRALASGSPELLSEVSADWLPRLSLNPEQTNLVSEIGIRSLMTVPLVARESTFGAITFIAAESGRRYGQEDVAFTQEIARRAAFAIENGRLYRRADEARGEAERRAREEGALRRATEALSASFTTEEVIQRIAESAVAATNADGAFVERIDSEPGRVVVVAAAGSGIPAVGARIPYSGSYAERVIERAEPETIPRLVDADRALADSLAERTPQASALVVPLVNAGEPIGGLTLLRSAEKNAFRPDEVQRAHTFGDLAALAFRRIHMLEESEDRREELQRVMESRTRLMRGFSHDVKNPLGAADGQLQLLAEGIAGRLKDNQREGIDRARRSIRSALGLIEDLLEFARAEAGQMDVEWSIVDVRDAVREIAEEYRAQAEAAGLAMEIDLPDELPLTESDASRVRQILGNLLSNAVKYTEEGGIKVSISLRSDADTPGSGRWTAVEVADTGPGIPRDKQKLLFQEFARFSAGQRAGAGVGLAISQRIARALGGSITFSETPGGGSTFVLWLPLERPGGAAGERVDYAA